MLLRISPVLLQLHFLFSLAASHVETFYSDYLFPDSEQDLFIKSHSDFSVVHPEKVDSDGRFISHNLSHHLTRGRRKRDLGKNSERVYYKVQFRDRKLTLNLTINDNLLSDSYVLEQRGNNLTQPARQTVGRNSCHLLGTVTDNTAQGTAAVSTCDGLMGLLDFPDGPYVIQPVHGFSPDRDQLRRPHVIYRSSDWTSFRRRRSAERYGSQSPCGVKDAPEDSLLAEQEREEWERESRAESPRRLSPRSVSKERWVETMVVADSKLMDYHGSGNVESYIFTIMNMVAGIFHDPSIGNAVHIVLVRLILLHGEEKGLKIVHHADSTLSSFCAWQKNLNPQSDSHPAHHDVAVLITRKDICAGMNKPCETLGLSHLSGMCQPHRSCNINEDSGLPVAFTIAHELGHSFGIHHDGQGNDCELEGRHPFIMSRQLHYDSSPLTWSPCSKDYITRFLDRGWGFCLDDRPSKKDLTAPVVAPGVRYTPHHQCQLQYGPNATFCHEVENVCQILWCSVNGSCRSKLDSPIDGTRCGPDKWCISGECVIVGKLPETVNGGWGEWSVWSHCSRTCGAGVQSAERECDRPKPEFGGKYCTGERKRYRICSTNPCVKKRPTFRDMQCSEFDTVPHNNQLYQWVPVTRPAAPCELHCRPVDEDFSEKMLDAVTDGTPCFTNNNSRSVCINGVCKAVGCDYGIDSNAEEDRCGVCLGDGSSCETVGLTFTEEEGYDYVDVAIIPKGARDIFIHEVAHAGNFLALRAADSEEYFLNGNYIIQWNGEYEAAGAKFYYERSGNMENLTSAGPTTDPVLLQLLFQELNPGVNLEYTIKRSRQISNKLFQPEYTWKYGAWTDCSATCGLGEQYQPIRCFEMDLGVVEESLCDPVTRPSDRHRKCKLTDCPARWWVGGWQPCSAMCGPDGVKKRTVLCVRTVASEERVLHPGDCRHLLKPKPVVPCNRDVPCGRSDWVVGNWSECSLPCGGGVKSRIVMCVSDSCDPGTRPRSTVFCNLQSCSSHRRIGPPFRPRPRKLFPHIPTQGPGLYPVTTLPPKSPVTLKTSVTSLLNTPTASHLVVEDERDYIVIRNTLSAIPSVPNPKPSPNPNPSPKPNPKPSPKPSPNTEEEVLKFKNSSPDPRTRGKGRKTEVPKHLTPTRDYENLNAPNPVSMNAFWIVGNWSKCSTSCGLGAVWRSVLCSAPQETDCDITKKPDPARRCNLGPCAAWNTSSWSKCPEGCVGGTRHRDVQCIDTQSKRPLRPFHCQALTYRPPSTLPCNTRPCLQWRLSPWGKCSRSCGGGQRERLVYCPQFQRCNVTLKPNSTEPCNVQACVSWSTSPWQQCSKMCGGGVQKRPVRCVNKRSGQQEENSLCVKNSKPHPVQKCNLQDCKINSGVMCKKNSMSSRFCEKLKLLGRCSLRSVRKQCCATCMM
ncbi:A disintegrin and metalloproteinase with thrombospondin motifs 12-like [Chanos chanos]|uniref:A disintegrin and metalloproteinase with thrombospondin motifs 12-like n=1 Tax=Chanos chanos TaxID=29144 RepID=A0A6J2WTH9_CHACN|nr:A disintegrin and metalloproteinase with thrombospondin motifs 12-like [Chanos chanos]